MKTKKKRKVLKKSPPEDRLKKLTERIISAAREVYSQLGPGLSENVYEEALAHEFSLSRMEFERQKEITILYKGKVVGWHRVDYLVRKEILVEVKAAEDRHRIYEQQLLTCLRASDKKMGLLINFHTGRFREGVQKIVLSERKRENC